MKMNRAEALAKLAAGKKVSPIIERYYKVQEPQFKNRFKLVSRTILLWRTLLGMTKGQ